ncbi:hypothetical protein HYQ46_007540 [Verticillium longisporum]|nr:hypothetical protein HYQ44_016062 [Verticillium longisporum]KAG7143023.1 hypothetical protein HYQ46_007540 [Verticillium longisporum]
MTPQARPKLFKAAAWTLNEMLCTQEANIQTVKLLDGIGKQLPQEMVVFAGGHVWGIDINGVCVEAKVSNLLQGLYGQVRWTELCGVAGLFVGWVEIDGKLSLVFFRSS